MSALSDEARSALDAEMHDYELVRHAVLYEPGDAISEIVFPGRGLVSLIVGGIDRDGVEVAMIGRDGAVGLEAALGVEQAFTRAIVSVPGIGRAASATAIRELMEQHPTLRDAVQLSQQALLAQTAQLAGCAILHPLEGRLCRWLLQALDRLDGPAVPITQEILAQRLGVHRGSLNEANANLRRAGLIQESRRGWVHVPDRERLMAHSCECYPRLSGFSATELINSQRTAAQ